LKALEGLKSLKNLDLEKNAVTKLSDYKQHMFRVLPSLQVLDSHNRYGELVFSDDEDD
jgi:Leucine-rich repeat (LRR) protein